MGKKQKIVLPEKYDVPANIEHISFRLDFDCAPYIVEAIRRYMSIEEKCYSQSKDIYKVTMKEIVKDN